MSACRLRILEEVLVLLSDVIVIQMWTLEQPIWQVRNCRLNNIKHCSLSDFKTICRYEILLVLLDCDVVSERILKTDVAE